MKCPRCETASLLEKDREGVVVDACPQCRGLWLDRGELEKLIVKATAEIDRLESHLPGRDRPGPDRPERGWNGRGTGDDRRDDRDLYGPDSRRRNDDDDDDFDHDPRRGPRRRGWLASLGEIFD